MPVCPICFWSCWPIPALAPMRLPAASTPICCMVTPPSASAPMAASEARSTGSLSGCFPNLVIVIPRIQTSSAMWRFSCSGEGLEAVADGLGARFVGADGGGGEPDLHPELDVLGVGLDVHEVAPHARPVAVDDRSHEGHRHAGGGEGHDGERAHLARRRHRRVLERRAAARRTGVAPVEEAGSALRA